MLELIATVTLNLIYNYFRTEFELNVIRSTADISLIPLETFGRCTDLFNKQLNHFEYVWSMRRISLKAQQFRFHIDTVCKYIHLFIQKRYPDPDNVLQDLSSRAIVLVEVSPIIWSSNSI